MRIGPLILHDGQIAHVRHAKIARRVNLWHAPGIAEDPKSAPSSARPASIRGALAIVTNVGCGMRWTLWCRKTNDADSGRQSRVVLAPRCWRQVVLKAA